METVFPDAIAEGPVGEECVSHNEMGEFQQLLAVPLDHPDVVLSEGLVAHPQLGGTRSLVGTKHHAVVGIDVYQPKPHDLQPVLHGTCASRPETTNMRGLPSRLADEAWVNGYGLSATVTKEPACEGDVQAKPVDALRAPAAEVLPVALLAVLAEPAQLGEIYLSRYDHVQ